MQRNRRFRPPVLSRLTLAWLGAFGVFVALSGLFVRASFSGEGAARIALPVEGVEVLARASQSRDDRLAPPIHEARLSPPQLRDTAPGEDTEDALGDDDMSAGGLELIYPREDDLFTDEEYDNASGNIVITIPAQGSAAVAARAASLTPVNTPIADPDPALLRNTPLGKTPRVAADGRKSVRVYAKPHTSARNTPQIAIIVSGLGLNAAVTERAIDDLPAAVSLSFAPYAKNLDFWTQKARRAGHEVLIELPMEGYGGNSQALGAAALLSSRSPQENLQRLDWLMSRFGGYFAATNYMGAKFSADPTAMEPVLRKLKESGLGYVDDTGAARRVGNEIGVPLATVTRMIPAAASDDDRRAVKRELAALEQLAERDGGAIGKTYAYAATIEEIAEWARSLDNKGLAHAPASALLQSGPASR